MGLVLYFEQLTVYHYYDRGEFQSGFFRKIKPKIKNPLRTKVSKITVAYENQGARDPLYKLDMNELSE